MDELTLLRNTRDDTPHPTSEALAAGRAALLGKANGYPAVAETPRPRRTTLSRLPLGLAAGAVTMTVILIVGGLGMNVQSAHASNLLRAAAAETAGHIDLAPGPGEYLRVYTHASWMACNSNGWDEQEEREVHICAPNEQIIDVYMPTDRSAEWVLYRDWGENGHGVLTGERIEIARAVNGDFYPHSGPVKECTEDGVCKWIPIEETSWLGVELAEIPLDGSAAYEWIDSQYIGGSASRAEDNFDRITSILRTGLIPAAQRSALLDALARVPGVTVTQGVANLDGVVGDAIGRSEPLRFGERREIIIDPSTGLVIGERTLNGTTFFGWGTTEVVSLTAIESSIVDVAP